MKNFIKFSIILILPFLLILTFTVSANIEANIETPMEKKLVTSISVEKDKRILFDKDRTFIVPCVLAEMTGANVNWIEGKKSNISWRVTITYPWNVLGKQLEKKTFIAVQSVYDKKFQREVQKYTINNTEYYSLYSPNTIATNISIRATLEPIFEIKWIPETRVIEIYDNPYYNRVKLLSKSSEAIINYELHKLNSGLIKQNEEIFIPLREFIELMKGKIEYSQTSEYNSPKIIIKPANIDKEIKIYPKIGKAVLTNNESKEEKEITLTKKMISRNGSYFIGVDDLISILQAEKHTYLDSDVNVYFNFEF